MRDMQFRLLDEIAALRARLARLEALESTSVSTLDDRYWQQWTRVLVVDAGGLGDYTTPEAACAYVATQSPSGTARWLILVMPGSYTVSPFTIPTYCTLRGWGQKAIGNALPGTYFSNSSITAGALITMDVLSSLENVGVACQAQAGTTANVYALYSASGATVKDIYVNTQSLTTSYQTYGVYGIFTIDSSTITAPISYTTACHFTGTSQIRFSRITSRASAGAANYGIVNASGNTVVFHSYLGSNSGDFFNLSINVTGGTVSLSNTPYKSGSGAIFHLERFYTDGSGLREAASATDVPLTVQGASAQSDPLTNWKDSSGNVVANVTAAGGATFNDNGADADFVVEGDTDTDLIHVDASADKVGISEAAPNATLDVNGTTRLGDSDTNYVGFATDGELTLAGTARVKKEIYIGISRQTLGASAPTATTRAVGDSGSIKVPVLSFSKTIAQETYFEIHMLPDCDGSVNVSFHLMWFPGAAWTAGNYMWKLDYLVKNESGVALNTGTPTTIEASVTPSAATDVMESEFANTIDIGPEQVLWGRLWRDVANDNGDDVGEVRFCELEYTSNKLGEAT